MRIVIVLAVVAGLVVLAGAGFMYWQTTPLYAFQEAAISYKQHDVKKFHRYVNTDNIANDAFKDLLFEPLTTNRNLTRMQQDVAVSALMLADFPIRKAVSFQIDNLIASEQKVQPPQSVRDIADDGSRTLPAPTGSPANEPPPAPPAVPNSEHPSSSTAGTLKEVLGVAKRELQEEGAKLKNEGYRRIDAYMSDHPHTTMAKLWATPRDERGETIKNILNDAGFVPANFRGVSSGEIDGSTVLKATFWSPRANREVAVEIEFEDQSTGWLSQKRISGVHNLREIVRAIDPDYDQEIQGLLASSLSGVSERTVAREARAVVKRIGKDPATQKLLGRAREFLEKMKEEK